MLIPTIIKSRNKVGATLTEVSEPEFPVITTPTLIGTLAESELGEISGLAFSTRNNYVLWGINDGGNPATMYAINAIDGTALGRWPVNQLNTDWEEIISYSNGSESYLLVCDTGDNNATRSTSRIDVYIEPLLGTDGGSAIAPIATTTLSYPASGSFNVEAVATDGTYIYLMNKTAFTSTRASLHRVPLNVASDATVVAEYMGDLPLYTPTPSPVTTSVIIHEPTALDINATNDTAYLLTYDNVVKFDRGVGETWSDVFLAGGYFVYEHAMPLSASHQAESLAIANNNTVWISSEISKQLWALPANIGSAPVATASTTITITPDANIVGGEPVTFGLPFKASAFPASSHIEASIGGTPLPIQVDLKSHHSSEQGLQYTRRDQGDVAQRSVSHAVMSFQMPSAVTSGTPTTVDLAVVSGAAAALGAPIAWPATPIKSTITMVGDSSVWVADIATVTASLFTAPGIAGSANNLVVSEWLSGDVCREWIVKVPFLDTGSQPHPHLMARYSVRAYVGGEVRVDAIIESNWSYVAGVGSWDYDIDIEVDNVLRYQYLGLEHFMSARWKVELWKDWPVKLNQKFDPVYLMATKAFPNYNPALIDNMNGSYISTLSSEIVAPTYTGGVKRHTDNTKTITTRNINNIYDFRSGTDPDLDKVEHVLPVIGPMSTGPRVTRYMPQTGARSEIAPLPEICAAWMLTQDATLMEGVTTLSDGAGSWNTHFRDELTDLPVSIIDRPNARWKPSEVTADIYEWTAQSAGAQTIYSPDDSHCGQFSISAYLITGDWYHLEELQFWGTYCATRIDADYRNYGNAELIMRTTRAQGWSLRTFAYCAAFTPDTHILKSTYQSVVNTNRVEYDRVYTDNAHDYGTVYSVDSPIFSPWMDDYITYAAGLCLDLGYSDYQNFAEWKGRFPVGRMGYGKGSGGAYCWVFAAAYQLINEPVDINNDPTDQAEPRVLIDRQVGGGVVSLPAYSFTNFSDVYNASLAKNSYVINTGEACGSAAQASALGITFGAIHSSASPTAFIAQLGISLAAAVDAGSADGALAWDRYINRADLVDHTVNAQFALVPRT